MAIKINGTSVIDDDRNISSVGIATVGSGSSTTTIDGNTGIVNVGTGVTIDGIAGNISIAGTISAAGLNVPLSVTTFTPTNGSSSAYTSSYIDLTFDRYVGIGTTGTVVFREGSVSGVGVNTLTVSNASVISNYIIRFTYSGLSTSTTYYPVFSPDLITSDSGQFLGINTGSGPSYNFTTNNFKLNSINPVNGATNVGLNTSITLTFTSTPTRGTGTIEIRNGSVGGTLVESFDAASSNRISISGNNYIIDPTNNLGFSTSYHTIIPSTAITGYAGLNTTGASSHSFTTKNVALGDAYFSGYLICQSSGVRWIVAPVAAEVSRGPYSTDANRRAQEVTGCAGWFIPSCGQLQNPGYACRTYWDSYSSSLYWSTTNAEGPLTWAVSMSDGSAVKRYFTYSFCTRSFRCVFY
jgi:hypothetical protein